MTYNARSVDFDPRALECLIQRPLNRVTAIVIATSISPPARPRRSAVADVEPFSMMARTMRMKCVSGRPRRPLRPVRHAGEREHEAGEQHVRQEEHHRHLHRLQLVLRERREGVADDRLVVMNSVLSSASSAGCRTSERRTATIPRPTIKARLEKSDQHIGRDLAEHDLDRL